MKNSHDINKSEFRNLLSEDNTIEPGILDIDLSEDALVKFAEAHSVQPPASLRDKILKKINALEIQNKERKKLDPTNLPMLAENSNWLDWQAYVEDIVPPTEFDNIHLHSLESNEKRDLFVAWVKQMVDEEVHYDILESFVLLEGACECHIRDEKGETRIVRLRQGDHITMQIGETHDIVITSLEPAKAILEWRKLAA
ncbi:MAG: hypothetical protein IPN76_24380 [Saprospiraceae bacterium]|nr:hypothetical protein [Saprospiraceae bacterium]